MRVCACEYVRACVPVVRACVRAFVCVCARACTCKHPQHSPNIHSNKIPAVDGTQARLVPGRALYVWLGVGMCVMVSLVCCMCGWVLVRVSWHVCVGANTCIHTYSMRHSNRRPPDPAEFEEAGTWWRQPCNPKP